MSVFLETLIRGIKSTFDNVEVSKTIGTHGACFEQKTDSGAIRDFYVWVDSRTGKSELKPTWPRDVNGREEQPYCYQNIPDDCDGVPLQNLGFDASKNGWEKRLVGRFAKWATDYDRIRARIQARLDERQNGRVARDKARDELAKLVHFHPPRDEDSKHTAYLNSDNFDLAHYGNLEVSWGGKVKVELNGLSVESAKRLLEFLKK